MSTSVTRVFIFFSSPLVVN